MPSRHRARGLRARGDRARRRVGSLLRPRRRLRPAARVDRRAARRRARARRRHERLAPGLRLSRRAARRARRARARRGADVRPAAEDPPRLGAEIVGLPMDDDGLQVDALERALATARSPRSSTRSRRSRTRAAARSRRERRRRIAELAREHDLLVLEDDPYGLVRYEGEAPPTIFELEGGTNVAYCVVVLEDDRARRPRRLLRPAAGARGAQIEALAVSTYISPPFLTQATVLRVREPGRFEPNLERVSGLLGARRDAMLDGARAALARGRELEPARGRLLHLARPPVAPRGRAARARGRRRRHRSSRAPTSSPAAGRRALAAARVQLRLARRDRRGRLGARGATARRAGAGARSSCDEQDPADEADREAEQDQPDERHAGRREHEVDVHRFRFSSTNAIA